MAEGLTEKEIRAKAREEDKKLRDGFRAKKLRGEATAEDQRRFIEQRIKIKTDARNAITELKKGG